MRGVTHYFIAAALVSLIPSVMWLAIHEKSFIIVLGAIAGILPDYIDFKIVRFLWRVDEEILPEWPFPDPERVAKKVAELIDKAWMERRTINVQFHTIKTGPNTWRRWYVYLDPDKQIVRVGIGPVQTFGGRDFPATMEDVPEDRRVGEAKFNAPLVYGYKDRTIKISILTGPMVAFTPRQDHVEVIFLPWHRYMSHSFTLAGMLSLAVLAIALMLGSTLYMASLYALVFFVGFSSHIITDHFGYMGSNFFWPITKRRVEGFKWMESMDPYANFAAFWLSLTILFWQMNVSVDQSIQFPWTYEVLGVTISLFYLVVIMVVPVILILLLRAKFWHPKGDPYLRNILGEETTEILG